MPLKETVMSKPMWDLKRSALKLMAKAKTGTVKVLGTWTDDHQPCVSIHAKPKGGPTIKTELWWLDTATLLKLGNKDKAWGIVRTHALNELDEMEQDTDFLRED